MAKCLLEQSKCGNWNIECGDIEYFHQSASKYPIGHHFSDWSWCQWCDYSAHLQVQKLLTKVMKLVDIVMLAIAVFEMNVSKALNNGEIDK